MADYFAGLDIGSTMTKAVILEGETMIASVIGPTGPEHRRLAGRVMEEALQKAGIAFGDLAFRRSYRVRKDKRSLRGQTGHGDHLPRKRHSQPSAFRTYRSRRGRAGQQGHQDKGRQGRGLRHERQVRGGHGPLPRRYRRGPGRPPGKAGRAVAFRRQAGRDQQYLHGLRRARGYEQACGGREHSRTLSQAYTTP